MPEPHSTPITVLAHARVPSPEAGKPIPRGLVEGAELAEALARVWPTDAHLTAYAPVEVPVLGTDETMAVRLTRSAIAEGVVPRLVALIGDVDPPGHRATPDWRADVESRLRQSGLAWYRTRNGYRVVTRLPEAFELHSQRDEAEWTSLYLGWIEHCRAVHGLVLDEACKDWTRLYRLPNVRRDGRAERSRLSRAVGEWSLDEWMPPTTAPAPSKGTRGATHADAALERAAAIAERMPPSVEGHGGDESLFRCARELATVLHEDVDAIEFVLGAVFNPRCLPAWGASKLRREAERAAVVHADPVERRMRRAEERQAQAAPKPAAEPMFHAPASSAPAVDPWDDEADFTRDDEPIEYYCEGLRLAPSKGKISLIAGQPGGGKGPIANALAVAFAFGDRALGQFPCTRSNVLLIDCEGRRLTTRRLRRLAKAMGHDPQELAGRVVVLDGGSLGDLTQPEQQTRLADKMRERDCHVLVLDSYTTAMLPTGIEPNSPAFATLAQQLGQLDVLVIAVAHANKAAAKPGVAPSLSDIAYTGAFGALAQTAIMLHYPDAEDGNRIRVTCARAPEEPFRAFEVVCSGGKDEPLSIVVAEPAEEKPAEELPEGIRAMRTRLAAREKYVEETERLLESVDTWGDGLTVAQIRAAVGINQRDWTDVRVELRKRGTIVEEALPGKPVKLRLRAAVEAAERGEGLLPVIEAPPATRLRPRPRKRE